VLKTCSLITGFILLLLLPTFAQQAKSPGVVPSGELKTIVPTAFFYQGQVAPVQLRNSAAVRTTDGKYVVAGLVDTSGYSAGTAQKYQGFFITEVKVQIGKSTVSPGQYGFGFTDDGKFQVMDAAGNNVLTEPFQQDTALKHPVPLKMAADGSGYRLYSGKKYVTLTVK
jgi:hypothetical protein